jgi:hypothetical protein
LPALELPTIFACLGSLATAFFRILGELRGL